MYGRLSDSRFPQSIAVSFHLYKYEQRKSNGPDRANTPIRWMVPCEYANSRDGTARIVEIPGKTFRGSTCSSRVCALREECRPYSWRGRARSVEPSLCSTRESVELEDRRQSRTAPSRIIRAKAEELRAKLDVGKPAIAMAAHNGRKTCNRSGLQRGLGGAQ